MKFISRIVLILLLLTICSCSLTGKRDADKDLSVEEHRFDAHFSDELLVNSAYIRLHLEAINATREKDILPITKSLVKPVVYDRLLGTEEVTLKERKSMFIAQMLPHILITQYYLQLEQKILDEILRDAGIQSENFQGRALLLKKLLARHHADNTNDLLQRLSTTPTSIILAEAALQSDWGRSLAYSRANNPFNNRKNTGQGSRLRGSARAIDLAMLKNYSYPPRAVLDYLQKINRDDRFREFRKMRSISSDPVVLTKYLGNTSAKQDEKYRKLLKKTITQNNLTRYDSYSIDPDYIDNFGKIKISETIDKILSKEKIVVAERADNYAELGKVSLAVKRIAPVKKDDIVAIEGKYVVPYVYTKAVNLDRLSVKEKKRKFFDMLLPSILVASYEIEEARAKLKEISRSMQKGERISPADQAFVNRLLKEWKAQDIDDLLNTKIVLHPCSIMLAQAALETGWGSSRFFTRANNTFGVWSFNPRESRMKARETRGGKAVYVKKYDNLYGSIIDYYKLIARGPYKEYREASGAGGNNPYEMIKYLNRYSELGDEYVRRLRLVMRQSALEKYDSYRLDPAYML